MPSQTARRTVTLIALIAAGEAAFMLPFLPARVFRPTVLDVFDLTNLQLGTAYSVYGMVALAAYLAGGPLADRFGPRGMLIAALLATAAGGLVLITIPGLNTLIILYGYWGVTTIALFWAPLIRATREWGGDIAQGRAFGLLDGGRGLLAAVTGSLLVMVFAALLPLDPDAATPAQRTAAMRQMLLILIVLTASIAMCLRFALPATAPDESTGRLSLRSVAGVLRLPAVWLQALIILCAYSGFRAIDDFPLYANQVLGLNEVEAAGVGAISLWMRPIAAVTAGFLADRFGAARLTLISFVLLLTGSVMLASGLSAYGVFVVAVACASLGVFALRGLYFAIMREGRIPLAVTGTAVGFVSFIGYTPDVFMGPLMGYLLDSSPGIAGHQDVFMVVSGFAVAGLAATVLFGVRPQD